ncbi:hypothetical protein M0R72_14490 [Candidatus Pacearchaeota archaeon]|jgi:hypothetical protein|nr:hypothetical protein [Candidatus Pacearchaeota archaeon]
MLAATAARDVVTWRLLDRLGEFGERRRDRRIAKMTMHIVACLRTAKSGPVQFREFLLPAIDDREEPPSDADEVERFDRAAGLK